MKLSNVTTIYRKELKDTLRDRRTLIFMLLVPIVAIPLLITAMSWLMVSQITKIEEEISKVAVQGQQYLPSDLHHRLTASTRVSIVTDDSLAGKDPVEELKAGNLDLILVFGEDFKTALEREEVTGVSILYDEAEEKSEVAERRLKEMLTEYREELIAVRMKDRGLSSELLTPFEISSSNVASMQKLAGKGFGTFLPYLIIVMCFMGAMYPAIDLAAGEKERGTLETLLVSPATRGEFVVGKYLVVLTTGIVAAFLSLGSLIYSLHYMVAEMFRGLTQAMSFDLDAGTVALVLLVVVPLAGIFAGILLSVSIFARSFKEAQSYITSLNMLVILPAIVSFLPGVELSYQLALIPVVNASLIMKDAISGSVQWQFVFAALLANTILAALSLLFSRKWFEREAVLFRT